MNLVRHAVGLEYHVSP